VTQNISTAESPDTLHAIQTSTLKPLFIITITLILSSVISCKSKGHDKTFKVFNEGVSLNLKAADEQEIGNFEKAIALNKQSIDKFKETLQLDSSHPLVRGALAHSLYMDKQFREAITWFEQANKISGDFAVNYREMGLCNVNVGQMQAGKSDIDKAFSMDTTKEIREITIQDLTDIGKLAFSYGDGYIQDGDTSKGKDYKLFSISVLMLAFQYDSSKKDIALTIADYADRSGDKETGRKYRMLANK
jgi:tetratricopeptide (TPR) repeat protein